MVRGKEKVNDAFGNQLQGKQYKEAITEIVKLTAMRAGDLDTKAVALLDHLQSRGRAKEACDYLKQNLNGTARDRVSNWRGYIYTLLRGFDEDAYSALKAEQAAAKAEEKSDRRTKKAERRSSREEEEEEKDKGDNAKSPAKESVATSAPTAKNGTQESKSSKADAKPVLNQAAMEFVPGAPWEGAGVSPKHGKRKDFDSTAVEFVPGSPWTGPGSVVNKGQAGLSFSQAAPEFVPGQLTWAGSAEAAAAAASAAMFATSGMQMGAQPFVPGRPWPQAQYPAYQQASPKAGAASKKNRNSTGGAGQASAKGASKGAGGGGGAAGGRPLAPWVLARLLPVAQRLAQADNEDHAVAAMRFVLAVLEVSWPPIAQALRSVSTPKATYDACEEAARRLSSLSAAVRTMSRSVRISRTSNGPLVPLCRKLKTSLEEALAAAGRGSGAAGGLRAPG